MLGQLRLTIKLVISDLLSIEILYYISIKYIIFFYFYLAYFCWTNLRLALHFSRGLSFQKNSL